MNKKLIFLSIVIILDMLFTITTTTTPSKLMTSADQSNHAREVSFSLQATAVPPIQIPTIVINPTPAPGGGGAFQFGPLTILLLIVIAVLIGGIILIALIAVARKP